MGRTQNEAKFLLIFHKRQKTEQNLLDKRSLDNRVIQYILTIEEM